MHSLLRFTLLCSCFAALQAASWEGTITSNGVGRAVFVPDTSRPVKAVLITNFNDPNLQGRPDVLYPNADLRALGAKWNMMQMHWLGRPESDSDRLAEYNAIVDTLKQASTLLGKPEIQFTGIFIQGLSGTASIAADIAKYNPSRFGGIIQTHYSYEAPPAGTPSLYVVGGLDTTTGFPDITLAQQLARVAPRVAAGEPETIYLEPGQLHDTAAVDQKFTALWLDEILTLRFPATIPTTSMINLPSWKNYRAWTGCYDASVDINSPWNRGERPINNTIQAYPSSDGRPWLWLPSQRVAQAWKTYMDTGVFPATTAGTVALSAPAAGSEYAAGATVTAAATASATSGSVTKVEFFDNGTLVGSDTNGGDGWTAAWSISSTTNHALTAKATVSSGAVVSSSPVNVLVRRPPDVTGTTVQGLNYAYYEYTGNGSIPDFTGMTPIRSGTTANFDITAGGPRADSFVYRFTGYLQVPTAGSYTLFTTSDDGSQLFIGSTRVVNNDGPHPAVEQQGAISLAAGSHAITVTFAQATGGKSLTVQWQGPGIAKQSIPSSALVRPASGDSTPPATPPAPTVSGNGTATPTLSGTTEAGATVRVYDGGALIATTAANGSGAWSVTVTLAVGSHSLTVTASDSAGNTSGVSPAAVVSVNGSALPSPWLTSDVGAVGLSGSATYDAAAQSFSVKGAGADIWGMADGFRYVYRSLTGDGQIVARVASQQFTDNWAKAGVMFRDGTGEGSAHATMEVTAGQGAEFVRRPTAGGTSLSTVLAGRAAPEWVRMVRAGSLFTGSVSEDGVNWTQVGSTSIAMGPTISVGLAVCSHLTSATSAVTFDHVTVGSGPSIATSPIDINFQPAAAAGVTGYLIDSGLAYGARNGQSYGWNVDTSAETRDRNLTSDQLKDTLIHLQRPSNPNASWEIALPNGQYQVRVVAGDPSAVDSVYRLDVEGIRVVDGTPTTANPWLEGTVMVTITDGRLTLSNAAGAVNNKVCFIEIVQVPVAGG